MQHLVEQLSTTLREKSMMLVTAESCTGGMLAATITHRAGASDIFERGFVTYSNQAKHEELGVPQDMLEQYGAVSAPTAQAMAQGALQNSQATIAISITGIAGPDGGSEEKPVGTVYIGYAFKDGKAGSIEHLFNGERTDIRTHSVLSALKTIVKILKEDE